MVGGFADCFAVDGMQMTGAPLTLDVVVRDAGRYALKKLPEVTLAFWVMKIAATTLGETAGDLFAQTLRLGYFLTTLALFAVFLATLVVQLRSRRYNPFFYWTVILSTSMAGTTISDFMNRDASARYLSDGAHALGWGPQGLGLGYPAGAAILVSNTLGTSMGDFLSDSSGLGYAGSALLIIVMLAVLLGLRQVPTVPNVVLFWIAFVLTRPLGATAGDLLTKPVDKGGLNLGTLGSSLVLLTVLLALMAHAHLRERRREPRQTVHAGEAPRR
jgi:uncharacterized membrane-anchored protein